MSSEPPSSTPKKLQWLEGNAPQIALLRLNATGKLSCFLPEVAQLFGVPQNKEHHPEVDTGTHTAMTLKIAAELSPDPKVRFAALVHDLGKGVTPKEQWPRHIDHELTGLPLVSAVCDRLRVPNDWRELALLVCEHHLNAHRFFELSHAGVLRFLERTKLESSEELLADFVHCVEADKRGRAGREHVEYRQGQALVDVCKALSSLPAMDAALKGSKEWQLRHRARLDAAMAALAPYR